MANVPKSRRLKALATYKVLIAQARAELGTAKVDNRTIAGIAKIAALSAVGKPRFISAAVRATFLTFGAETGKFFIPLSVEDTFTAGEIRNVNVSKLKINEINAVDRALAEVYKVLSDPFQVSEVALLHASKQLDDLLNMGDIDVLDIGKALNDSPSALDLPVRDITKPVQDPFSAADLPARHLHKAVSDTVAATSALSFFFGAYKASGFSAAEFADIVITAKNVPPQLDNQLLLDLAALGVNKNINDNIGVTDDVYGEANIGDDQIAFVGKSLPQTVSTSDLRAIALQRTLQESAGAAATGVVALTNYCDSTYFSQAYVGIEQTF
tara:strand:+ start:63 stop:1040 length:978 start_codon:yes stop_codon:yes gene_type:complete